MFCAECGSDIPTGVSRCTKCGAISQVVSSDEIIPERTAVPTKSEVSSHIPLEDGETILWHRDSTHGLIHKELSLEEAVTNKRCLKFDVQNNRVTAQVGIQSMPEVVIMNAHRVNNSLGGGVFLTPRLFGLPGLPIGVYGGPRRGHIKIFGDVSLMMSGML
jgi:hypothetical protein